MEKVSLYQNELGEFVDLDSDADAELRRRKAYSRLIATPVNASLADKEPGRKGGKARERGVFRTCPTCGKSFKRRRSDKVYCTPACARKANYERKKGKR